MGASQIERAKGLWGGGGIRQTGGGEGKCFRERVATTPGGEGGGGQIAPFHSEPLPLMPLQIWTKHTCYWLTRLASFFPDFDPLQTFAQESNNGDERTVMRGEKFDSILNKISTPRHWPRFFFAPSCSVWLPMWACRLPEGGGKQLSGPGHLYNQRSVDGIRHVRRRNGGSEGGLVCVSQAGLGRKKQGGGVGWVGPPIPFDEGWGWFGHALSLALLPIQRFRLIAKRTTKVTAAKRAPPKRGARCKTRPTPLFCTLSNLQYKPGALLNCPPGEGVDQPNIYCQPKSGWQYKTGTVVERNDTGYATSGRGTGAVTGGSGLFKLRSRLLLHLLSARNGRGEVGRNLHVGSYLQEDFSPS